MPSPTEYMREWRKKNADKIAGYNEKRRVGWKPKPCAHCGKMFEPASSQRKFCTPLCRMRNRRSCPEYLAWERKTQRAYESKNRERLNAYGRAHYAKHVLAKMRVQPWLSLLEGAKRRAKEKGIPFTLTFEWAEKEWTGRCAITGIEFNPPEKRVGYKNRNRSPSIDRIDPSGPYSPQNCRFVLWAVNALKRDSSDQELFFLADAISKSTIRIHNSTGAGIV